MPCYRCGIRQVDPDRGSSPWLRGVRSDRQVLICPGCQADGAWVTDLDRCALCASVRLVRRLGEVECRDCGAVGAEALGSLAGLSALDLTGGQMSVGGRGGVADAVRAGVAGVGEEVPAGVADGVSAGLAEEVSAGVAEEVSAGLAEEVEQALARVLRWPTARAAGLG